ncbi:MAG: hypothetical protein ABEI75_00235 [Halobaculum sp.]
MSVVTETQQDVSAVKRAADQRFEPPTDDRVVLDDSTEPLCNPDSCDPS